MKFYRSVLEKAEEINYKKGVSRIDINSGYYKVSKILYYIAFAWLMFFQIGYLFSNSIALLYYKRAAENVTVELYISFWAVFIALVAGFVLIKLKFHIAAALLNTVGGAALILQLGKNENVSLAFLEHGFLGNKHFWFYYAPAILIILFTLMVCAIGVKSYIHLKSDYKNAMAAMFSEYSQAHPEVSDIQWQEHLAALDAQKEFVKSHKGKKK